MKGFIMQYMALFHTVPDGQQKYGGDMGADYGPVIRQNG